MRLKNKILLVFARILFSLLSGLPKKYVYFAYADTSKSYGNLDAVYEKAKDLVPCRRSSSQVTLKNIILLAMSRIVVCDQTAPIIFHMNPPSSTICLQVWHSSGLYKKIGFDAIRPEFGYSQEVARILRLHGRIDYFVISDSQLMSVYQSAFHLGVGQVLPLGLARTDRLFPCPVKKQDGKKILLYAPTYRTGKKGRYQPCYLDAQALRKGLGDDWDFWFRSHPSVKKPPLEGWRDVSDMDQYECLTSADVLVTDYSSILFDFALLRRPVYLLVPDRNSYVSSERQLYLEPEQLCPGCTCTSAAELIFKVRSEPYHDPCLYERFMSSCDGHSSERIADFIKNAVANPSK